MLSARTRELMEKSERVLLKSFSVLGTPTELIFEKGKGVKLWDTEGKEYIDICSFFQCVNLGHGREELHDAILKQMGQIEFGCMVAPYANVPLIEYAEALGKVTPKNINRFIFTTGGTTSNEFAIKIARFYWGIRGKSSKYKVICLQDAYHGAGHLTGSLMGKWIGRIPYGPQATGIVRIPRYYCYRCPFGLKYPDCNIRCARFLETMIEIEEEDSIAAFIAEPIQGFGGGITPPPEYWPIVRDICTRHNVLLIADEVMSGFCRTGKMFAMEHWNVEPDIITMGKGITSMYLPFGAVGVSDKVYEPLPGHDFVLGLTVAGHPVLCAVAKAALDIYLKQHIAEHVTNIGNHVKERLEKEFLPLPHVGEITGLGLFLSMEIVANKETKAKFAPERDVMFGVVRRQCWERGLFPRIYYSSYSDRLFFTPPLIITEEEADRALDILYSIIANLKL